MVKRRIQYKTLQKDVVIARYKSRDYKLSVRVFDGAKEYEELVNYSTVRNDSIILPSVAKKIFEHVKPIPGFLRILPVEPQQSHTNKHPGWIIGSNSVHINSEKDGLVHKVIMPFSSFRLATETYEEKNISVLVGDMVKTRIIGEPFINNIRIISETVFNG